MQFTNVTELIKAIKNIEKADLIRALQEKGGFVNFTKKDTRVFLEFYGGNGPTSAELVNVSCTKRNWDNTPVIIITVKDPDGGQYRISPEDCYPGTLSCITQEI